MKQLKVISTDDRDIDIVHPVNEFLGSHPSAKIISFRQTYAKLTGIHTAVAIEYDDGRSYSSCTTEEQ